MSGELELLAYETALRTLDRQDHLLQELRARTGILLAASSLAVSFIAQLSFGDQRSPALTLSAIAVFVVAATASIYVLAPRRDLSFSPSTRAIYELLYELGDDISEAHRRLAYEMDTYRNANHGIIEQLTTACQASSIAVALEIALLAAVAADSII